MIQLPENLENYGEARKSGSLKMKAPKDAGQELVLTGGLCDSPYFLQVFSRSANRH